MLEEEKIKIDRYLSKKFGIDIYDMLQKINDINNDAQQEQQEQLQYMTVLDNFPMGKEKAFKNVESQRYLMEVEHKPLDIN